jgi:hypothetical protein
MSADAFVGSSSSNVGVLLVFSIQRKLVGLDESRDPNLHLIKSETLTITALTSSLVFQLKSISIEKESNEQEIRFATHHNHGDLLTSRVAVPQHRHSRFQHEQQHS